MCSIISKHTYFLLKVNLHCNLPHFRNVSNTSDRASGREEKRGRKKEGGKLYGGRRRDGGGGVEGMWGGGRKKDGRRMYERKGSGKEKR